MRPAVCAALILCSVFIMMTDKIVNGRSIEDGNNAGGSAGAGETVPADGSGDIPAYGTEDVPAYGSGDVPAYGSEDLSSGSETPETDGSETGGSEASGSGSDGSEPGGSGYDETETGGSQDFTDQPNFINIILSFFTDLFM